MRIWLVHGFNVSDGGKGSIDHLRPVLEAVYSPTVHEFDYGYTFLLGALFGNPGRSRELARLSSRGDIGIGHSNGCALLHRASNLEQSHFDHLIYINPALDSDAVPGQKVKTLDVLYSPDDAATTVAAWIPWVLWGDMGNKGYTGQDPRVKNYNLLSCLNTKSLGHSGAFTHPQFPSFICSIINNYKD